MVLVGTCGGGTRLVSEWKDGVNVWAVGNTARTWVCERTIQAPRFLSCLAVCTAATSIAGGEWGGDLGVWDAASGACHTTLVGHSAFVQAVWIDSECLKLVSASDDGIIRVWDVRACTATLDFGGGGCVLSVVVDESRLFCGVRSTVAQGDEGSESVVAVHV